VDSADLRDLRQRHSVGAAGAGDLLVLLSRALHRRVGHRLADPDSRRRVHLVAGDLHSVRGCVLLRDHARRHSVDFARADDGRQALA
jgi:hypothetical protein